MKPFVYKRPNKPNRLEVKRRLGVPERALTELPEVLAVDRATECHVTPPLVAELMVSELFGGNQ